MDLLGTDPDVLSWSQDLVPPGVSLQKRDAASLARKPRLKSSRI